MLTAKAIVFIVLITLSLVLELIFRVVLIYIACSEQNDSIILDKDSSNRKVSHPSKLSHHDAANKNY